MTRDRSQMTLEAFEAEQQQLTDTPTDVAPEPRALREETTSAVVRRFGIDSDTTPAVAPRDALDVLRAMEAEA